MKTIHEAGPTDLLCDVRCVRCGALLAPAMTWQTDEGREFRAPAGLRPSPGQFVAMTGDGPYFGRFVTPEPATCVASVAQAVA